MPGWVIHKLENSSRDENTRSLYLSPEKPVCRSRSNSWNRKWNDILVQSLDSSLSRLHFVTLLNFCAEHIMRNAGLDDAQAGIKIARRNINDLRYADDTTFIAESKEEIKSFLMMVREESENAGLKLNLQKTKIMASGPITSW